MPGANNPAAWLSGLGIVVTAHNVEPSPSLEGLALSLLLDQGEELGLSLGVVEETTRMPEHSIEVIDLGLTWSDAMDRGLIAETVERRKALPERLVERLEEEEPAALAAFEGEQTTFGDRPSWKVQRVELNAFSSSALVEYVENGLKDNGADEKLFPPEEVANELALDAQREVIRTRARGWLAEELDLDGIVEELVAEYGSEPPEDLIGTIETAAEEDRAAYWPDTVTKTVEAQLEARGEELRERFAELLDERRSSRPRYAAIMPMGSWQTDGVDDVAVLAGLDPLDPALVRRAMVTLIDAYYQAPRCLLPGRRFAQPKRGGSAHVQPR